MKICFFLPTPGDTPIGGVKVVYEHANALAEKGHEVSVAHTMTHQTRQRPLPGLVYIGRLLGLRGGYGPTRWMKVHPKVNIKWLPCLHPRLIPKQDIIVATAWRTAEWLEKFPETHGRKYYFIQDYEYFMTANESVRRRMAHTYKAGLKNIVISPACEGIVLASGGVVHGEVPNGIDLDRYQLNKDVNSPDRNYIGFPCRDEPFKCTPDAISLLIKFKAQPDSKNFRFWTFGAQRPVGLPDWIEFHQRPSDVQLSELYNRSAIFLVPSLYEGWGLPGSEAMACGAALLSVDNGGVRAYAQSGVNSLICPPGDPDGMMALLMKLVLDAEYRRTLGETAAADLRQYTWERSQNLMERALCQ